jgi:hypothetical protein
MILEAIIVATLFSTFAQCHPICYGFEAAGKCDLKIGLFDVPCVSASYGIATMTQLRSNKSVSSELTHFFPNHGCDPLPNIHHDNAIAVVDRGGKAAIIRYQNNYAYRSVSIFYKSTHCYRSWILCSCGDKWEESTSSAAVWVRGLGLQQSTHASSDCCRRE